MTQPAKRQLEEESKWPTTAPGFVWLAIGKYGIGIVGFLLLVPVYQDNKIMQREQLALLRESITASNSTATAMNRLVDRIDEAHAKVGTMKETVSAIADSLRRIETKQANQ